MILLNGDRSEAVEVELGKLLRHEKLALNVLAAVFDEFLLHFRMS